MHLFFTVTTDLTFDQRMQRICSSLARNGYKVTLVGRQKTSSLPLSKRSFEQKRIKCFFEKGFLFYAEYNIRLFFFLFSKEIDGICAIDLDTILPCLLISKAKKITRVYDAHELFTELKEVRTRPFVLKIWTLIERLAAPKFPLGYTVSGGLKNEFYKRYHLNYNVIRNIPYLESQPLPMESYSYILYQGMVNEGRGFEYLIPAMKKIDHVLVICGDGNFMDQLELLIKKHSVEKKVILKGLVKPELLKEITKHALIGINLVEKEGLNQYYSLPNKFFDYIHAGVPQVTMNYPEYKALSEQYNVALLIDDLDADTIAAAVNKLLTDDVLRNILRSNCKEARLILNWQEEEKKLLSFYGSVFPNASVVPSL